MAKSNLPPKGAVKHAPTASSATSAANIAAKGAAKHQINMAGQGRSWIRHHRASARDSYQRLWQTPIPTLMTLAVLAIALTLPGLMYLGLKNVDQLAGEWKGDAKISLYLQQDLTDAKAETFSQKMLLRQDLIEVELVTKAQGLLEFQAMSNFTDVLGFLDSNPLPAVVVVHPVDGSKQALLHLQQELSQLPEVEQAILDMLWVERLAAFVELANRLIMVLGGLLAFSVLLVVGNTIRLSIESRKDEVQISKLVGATDAWVRRPFIYTGFWFGLLGSIIAWLMVQLCLILIAESVSKVAVLYRSDFSLQGLGFIDSIILVIAAIFLGLGGAKLAVSRHLKEIEPQ